MFWSAVLYRRNHRESHGSKSISFKKITTGVFEGLHNHKSLNSENYCDVFLVATCHKFSTISKLKYKGNIMFYYFQWSIPLNHQFDHYRGYWDWLQKTNIGHCNLLCRQMPGCISALIVLLVWESHTSDVRQKLLVLQNLQKCCFGLNHYFS